VPRPETNVAIPSARILIADDEPDIREYLERILVRLGHVVVGAAQDGNELVAQCRTLRPDLVMTDIRMPGLDGIEAAAQIHREHPTAVILLSAQFDAELIERAEVSAVQAYLVKPIKASDLLPTIALALRRFQELRQLEAALAGVQHLRALLPICCYCKKIRDDQNYWQQVEAYLTEHAGARFSHGICPDCFEHVRTNLAGS